MTETALRIRLFGDPALKRRSGEVHKVTDRHRDILKQMSRLMYASQGIGLASPQVGINEAMIIADIGTGLYKLINPRILRREGEQALEEGCLSLPGVCIKVRRAKRIKVLALDESGRPVTVEAQDLLACVLQHEIDHLNGRLIVDYASFFKKIGMRKILRGFKERAKNEELPESKTKSCQLQL